LKKIRTRPEYSIIKVRILILIYILLSVLTILFSRNFFSDTLNGGKLPDRLSLIIFLTIPAVLLILLGISVFNLFTDIIARRPGSKFKARLLAYFIIIVFFAATPATITIGIGLNEIVHFWRSIDAVSATAAAKAFVVENYEFHADRLVNDAQKIDFSRASSLPPHIGGVQVFKLTKGEWVESSFLGDEHFKLPEPPTLETGLVNRDQSRDWGMIRYVQIPRPGTLCLISYNIGGEFEWGKAAIENEANQFEIIEELRSMLKPLLFFYYSVFFFPTILMTLIIAISFTRRVTHPIIELTEATRRVAEGDFSIQILARRNDELGLLIRSFNVMVQNLEKSRAALVRNEKISIWQNMAQQLAHEIKNPLTPIKLSAERVLRRWQNEPDKIGEIIESSMLAIIQETEGLSNLLNEFRTLSKPMEPSQSWTDLAQTIKEVISPYAGSYQEIIFNIDNVQNDISVKIEKQRLTQILTNIIINAIDAMNGSGTIEIRTDLVKKREVMYCRLSVKDSGGGISTSDSEFVFTPYFTTKSSGTGLGLPIVERIVNDHGGMIWFNSAEGVGTTFFIDLPSTDPQSQTQKEGA